VVKSLLTLKQIHHEAAALHEGHEEKNKQKIIKGSYFRIFKGFLLLHRILGEVALTKFNLSIA